MPQNHLLRPSDEQLMDCHTDITAPGHTVEIITDERGVLWVNVGPCCVLRVCRMTDLRIDVQGETPTQITRTFKQPVLPT
jgi:hypothetical protein